MVRLSSIAGFDGDSVFCIRKRLCESKRCGGVLTLIDELERNHTNLTALKRDTFIHTFYRLCPDTPSLELNRVTKAFEVDGDKVNAQEIVRCLKEGAHFRRSDLIPLIFERVRNGYSHVFLTDLEKLYSASRHPRVITYELTVQQAKDEFFQHFRLDAPRPESSPPDPSRTVPVTTPANFKLDYDAFHARFLRYSAQVPYDDAVFAMVCEYVWGVKEAAIHIAKKMAVGANPADASISLPPVSQMSKTPRKPLDVASQRLLDEAERLLRDKIRQRTPSHVSDWRMALLAFRLADANGNGEISMDEWKKALELFGVTLRPDQQRLLFESMDEDGNGVIDYNEFLRRLFNVDYSLDQATTS